jgi:hypothetical protein
VEDPPDDFAAEAKAVTEKVVTRWTAPPLTVSPVCHNCTQSHAELPTIPSFVHASSTISRIRPESEWLAKTAQIFKSGVCFIRLSVFTSQWANTTVLPLPATPRTSRGLPSMLNPHSCCCSALIC